MEYMASGRLGMACKRNLVVAVPDFVLSYVPMRKGHTTHEIEIP